MKQQKLNQNLVFNKITMANLEINEMNSVNGGNSISPNSVNSPQCNIGGNNAKV